MNYLKSEINKWQLINKSDFPHEGRAAWLEIYGYFTWKLGMIGIVIGSKLMIKNLKIQNVWLNADLILLLFLMLNLEFK